MADKVIPPPPRSLVTQISPSKSPLSDSASKCTPEATAQANFTASNPYNLCEFSMTPDMLNRSFNITLKFLSPAASSGPFCRICHEGDSLEDLISLCKCTGTVGLVHLTCMERWLSIRRVGGDGDRCEICNFTFETTRSPRSVREWYHSDQGAMSNRRNVLGDVACFSTITPLTGLSSFLCFEGAKQHVMWNNSLEAGCLMALATFLITVYLVWNVLTIRYHIKSFLKWRAVNQNVRLVRYRMTSSTTEPDNFQRNAIRTVESQGNRDSLTELVTNSQQTSPLLQETPQNSGDVTTQTNLYLTDT